METFFNALIAGVLAIIAFVLHVAGIVIAVVCSAYALKWLGFL